MKYKRRTFCNGCSCQSTETRSLEAHFFFYLDNFIKIVDVFSFSFNFHFGSVANMVRYKSNFDCLRITMTNKYTYGQMICNY